MFEGWSGIGEGWGEGQEINTDTLIENIKTTGRNFAGPVAKLLALAFVLKMLLTLLTSIVMLVGQFAEMPVMFTVATGLDILSIPLLFVVSLLPQMLFRPLQVQAFEGRDFVTGIGDAVRITKDGAVRVVIAVIAFGISICLGMLGCGIGALIPMFFFYQVPFLAATTELPIGDCFRRSYELNKAYFVPVLVAIAASMVIGGVVSGCAGGVFGALGGVLMATSPGLGKLVAGVGVDIFTFLSASAVLVISAGVLLTIQATERGTEFKR